MNCAYILKVLSYLCLTTVVIGISTASLLAQCVPSTRATYDIILSGSTSNGGGFSRTGRMIVDPRITVAGGANLNNGPNDREVGIVSGFPGGTPEPGAIWFFTNTAMCRPLGTGCNNTPVNAALDVVYTSISSNKLNITIDGTVYGNTGAGNVLTANLLNNFSARGGITASFYQIISGTIELTFTDNGRGINGVINITGTSGLGGVGSSTYTATISGVCATNASCACTNAPTLPNLTQQAGVIVAVGSSVNYDITIINNGQSTAGVFKVVYYAATTRGADATFFLLGQDEVQGLNPQRSTALRKSINACSVSAIRSGRYYFGYAIDLSDDVKENDENDNFFLTTELQSLNCSVSSIEEPSAFPLSVTPNPAQTHIVLNAANLFPETIYIHIYNMQGNSVLNNVFQNIIGPLTLDISVLPPGLYILSVQGKNVARNVNFIKQ